MNVKTRTIEEKVLLCDACGKEMPYYDHKEEILADMANKLPYTKHPKQGAKRKGARYAPEDYWYLCKDCQAKLEREYRQIDKEAKAKRRSALVALVKESEVTK